MLAFELIETEGNKPIENFDRFKRTKASVVKNKFAKNANFYNKILFLHLEKTMRWRFV